MYFIILNVLLKKKYPVALGGWRLFSNNDMPIFSEFIVLLIWAFGFSFGYSITGFLHNCIFPGYFEKKLQDILRKKKGRDLGALTFSFCLCSSTISKHWEAELATLKGNNAKLTAALLESTANVKQWKQQLAAYQEEAERLHKRVSEGKRPTSLRQKYWWLY